MESTTSAADPNFCQQCGSVLPVLTDSNKLNCYTCRAVINPESIANIESSYRINFNKREIIYSKKNKDDENEGPIVERLCSKCGSNYMSYATLQLRSADEGQTVFYTCVNCKFKESENS